MLRLMSFVQQPRQAAPAVPVIYLFLAVLLSAVMPAPRMLLRQAPAPASPAIPVDGAVVAPRHFARRPGSDRFAGRNQQWIL